MVYKINLKYSSFALFSWGLEIVLAKDEKQGRTMVGYNCAGGP